MKSMKSLAETAKISIYFAMGKKNIRKRNSGKLFYIERSDHYDTKRWKG